MSSTTLASGYGTHTDRPGKRPCNFHPHPAWRGHVDVELSMSADDVRHVHQLSRHLPAAKVSDGLIAPQVSFVEDDLGGFNGHNGPPTEPALLPGSSQHVHFDAEANGRDAFCNGHFDYVIGIDLLTFTAL